MVTSPMNVNALNVPRIYIDPPTITRKKKNTTVIAMIAKTVDAVDYLII